MVQLNAKRVASYVLLPGVTPRLKELSSSGFGYVAFLMAVLYAMVRILPHNHPYTNINNMGQFGMRHVIAEAAGHIVIKKENIDQIIIFLISITAFVLVIVQFVVFIYSLIMNQAQAAGLFETPFPENDIAFLLLDQVFGVPDMFCNTFGACTAIQGELPWPFHSALHAMFEYYSIAILLMAVLIFLYYILVVVGETALTGSPFGKRFNKIWAPMRLVVAVGALVPLNYGLNSGQYIVLTAAKYGSSVATNAWLNFNSGIASQMALPQPTGQPTEYLTAFPNAPDVQPLVTYMTIVKTCQLAYQALAYPMLIDAYLVQDPGIAVNPGDGIGGYLDALAFYDNGDIVIRFGEDGDGPGALGDHENHKGHVKPYCGEIIIHTGELDGQPGSFQIQAEYYQIVLDMFFDPEITGFALHMLNAHDFLAETSPCDAAITGANPDCTKPPLAVWRQERINVYQAQFEAALVDAWNIMRFSDIFTIEPEVLERGWGGAGIWYNTIAQMNGSWISSVHQIPSPGKYPMVMQKVMDERRKHDPEASGLTVFQPNIASGQAIRFAPPEKQVATAMYGTIKYFMEDDPNQALNEISDDSNVVFKVMNVLFGTYSLFNIRNEENQMVHPLAQLVGVGKGLVDSAIRNLGLSIGFAVGGGAMSAMGLQAGGQALEQLSGFFLSITMVGLVAGFILYYILPFLPFMYFYFAVIGWIKSVFEAMVGVPLWALAHLRVDGNGFPGDQAANGYFLVLEIFIRPILCVFGLIAGIAIFAASARVLHDVFELVINNLTGFDDRFPSIELGGVRAAPGAGTEIALGGGATFKRHVVDEFFFTIIYTIILYMMGTASFKLIDTIPQSILRWAGSGVQSFGDNRDDPTEGLIRYAAIGGATVGQQVTSGLQQMGKGAGQGMGALMKGQGRGGGTATGGGGGGGP